MYKRQNQPFIENDLPVIFNEFCTTWGSPTEENIRRAADALKGRGLTYFVIDSGWYKKVGGDWGDGLGDWELCEAVSYTHLRAHETPEHIVCRLLIETKKTT